MWFARYLQQKMKDEIVVVFDRNLANDAMYLSERFNKIGAFLDLCFLSNDMDGIKYIRGIRVDVGIGQVCVSEEELACRWRWSRNTVRKFLGELQKMGIVEQQKTGVISLITIKKYLVLKQWIEQQNEQQSEQQAEQQNEQQTEQQKNSAIPLISTNKHITLKQHAEQQNEQQTEQQNEFEKKEEETEKEENLLSPLPLSTKEEKEKKEERKKENRKWKKKKENSNSLFPDEEEKREEEKTWRTDRSIYDAMVEEAKQRVLHDVAFKNQILKIYPNLDFEKTLDRCCMYWCEESTYAAQCRKRTKTINMYSTLKNTFDKTKIFKSSRRDGHFEYVRKEGRYDADRIEVEKINKMHDLMSKKK